MRDVSNETHAVKFDITHAIGGGYMMKSNLCKNPESSSDPFVIYSIFQASSLSFDDAYDVFFEYIHEDIKAMTRIDLDFNIFQKLVLQYRDDQDRIRRRKFILEEILNNKSRMHSEIMASLKTRQLIATKVLMRVRDTEVSYIPNLKLRSRASMRGAGAPFTAEREGEAYVYIPVKKVYIFHYIQPIEGGNTNYISYSHSSLCALVEGVFSSLSSAENYASFYIKKTQELDKKMLSDYLENKYATVFNDYYNNELIKALWGIIEMVLVESDSIRFQILENVFAVLSHPISKLLHLKNI